MKNSKNELLERIIALENSFSLKNQQDAFSMTIIEDKLNSLLEYLSSEYVVSQEFQEFMDDKQERMRQECEKVCNEYKTACDEKIVMQIKQNMLVNEIFKRMPELMIFPKHMSPLYEEFILSKEGTHLLKSSEENDS